MAIIKKMQINCIVNAAESGFFVVVVLYLTETKDMAVTREKR